MKPILFDASESVFTSNGLGRLSDCISCFVEEERNGKYELEMEYPVSGDHFSEILHSRFIFAVPADGKAPQPFRIYAITKPIGGVCTIYAEHISYQLFHIPLNPFLPEASITRAFQAIKANAAEDCPFEFSTDKTTVANFKVDEPKSIREVLYGSEGSILDVYGGGEYEWDRYNVRLYQHRGTDRGVVLRYGKDITDLTQEENIEDTITGIYPFWKGQNEDEEDVLVTLPEKVVHSANAGNFPYKRTVTLDCSSEFETAPTVAQLRTYATNYISQNNIGVPDVSITVKFAPLWQTEEYKDIANLERVNLCDTVTVHYEKLGVDATAKVIRTKYDVLNERYEEIELGSAKSSVASVIRGDIQSAIETAAKRSTEIENILHVEITENTRKITGGLGGHVVLKLNADGEPEEILIMDTDDVTTAVNVWRFNMGGLGHSHSGYNGPFDDIALTMDGHINANMITVGTLNANLIKAGVLSDSQGINFIDMETGEMRIGASASLGGSTIAQHKANAVSTANGYTDAQLADYKDTVDAVVSNLQSQIDGQVMTWYYDYEPTMSNKPASDWTTTALRQQHEGDVFYWKSKGYAYRFMQSGSTWGWTLIQDTDITAAIAKAENAQDTADHKRRVFVTQPVPPYDIGDLWTQGSSGDLYRCETARASGSYVAGDWKKATKYTDDTAVTTLNTSLNQTEIFNRLTNNGAIQGIYMQNGQLYINATYIVSGLIRSTDGSVYFDLDNNEIVCSAYKGKKSYSGGLVKYSIDLDAALPNGFPMLTVRDIGARATANDFIGIIPGQTTTLHSAGGLDMYVSSTPGDTSGDYSRYQLGRNILSFSTQTTAGYVTFGIYASSGSRVLAITTDKALLNNKQIAVESSSSRRYKHSIAPLSEALDPHKLLDLPIVQFEWNDDHPLQYDDMRGQTIPGIIAEDVAEIYPAATIHDAEGRVESWDERRLIPGMLALIQEQDERIKKLEDANKELLTRLERLEKMLT